MRGVEGGGLVMRASVLRGQLASCQLILKTFATRQDAEWACRREARITRSARSIRRRCHRLSMGDFCPASVQPDQFFFPIPHQLRYLQGRHSPFFPSDDHFSL